MQKVPVKNFFIGKGQPLAILCGPCVIESYDHCMRSAEQLKKIFQDFDVNFVFKASYDKANRSAYYSFRGPGMEEGLKILQKVQTEFDLPVITDVHSPEEATIAGSVCDMIQIPAFLCRQTDLLTAAGKTPAAINVKKGQFLAPWDMKNVIQKILAEKNEKILLTDRGFTFGYNNLVSDMRAIPIMQKLGFPVCFDATHSVQLPGGLGDATGGQREFIPILAKSAVAAGVNCLFMEAHHDPVNAKSDAACVLDFKELPELMKILTSLYEIIHPERTECLTER